MIKVYIASPYSIGNKEENVFRQMQVADILISEGFCPYIPLLTHYQHLQFPQPYNFWLEYDLEWLFCCEAILRLDGESYGADKEEEYAKELGIPIFYDIPTLILYFDDNK